jgi:hypothetical protein
LGDTSGQPSPTHQRAKDREMLLGGSNDDDEYRQSSPEVEGPLILDLGSEDRDGRAVKGTLG